MAAHEHINTYIHDLVSKVRTERAYQKDFPMYHGSGTVFNKGDEIIGNVGGTSFANATDSKEFAEQYGHPYKVEPITDDVVTYRIDDPEFHGYNEDDALPLIHESTTGFKVLEGHPTEKRVSPLMRYRPRGKFGEYRG